MKLSDFVLLNENEKKQVVLNQGVLVAKRKGATSFVFLFRMDGFYVEAIFKNATKQVKEFRMSQQTTMLQPYLESICIDDLLS